MKTHEPHQGDEPMPVAMEQVRRMVSLQLGARAVRDEDRIVEDLGAESTDVVNIIATLEERYHVHITETEVARIRTVADLFRTVQSKL